MLILRKTFLAIRRAVADYDGHQQDAWVSRPRRAMQGSSKTQSHTGGIATGREAEAHSTEAAGPGKVHPTAGMREVELN